MPVKTRTSAKKIQSQKSQKGESSGGDTNFHWGGYSSEDLGNESPPVGSKGETSVGGLEAETVCRHCLLNLTTKTIKKLKILHNSPL